MLRADEDDDGGQDEDRCSDAQGLARGQEEVEGGQDDDDVGAGHGRQVRQGGGCHGVGEVGGHQPVVADCHARDESAGVAWQGLAGGREGPVCVASPGVRPAGALDEPGAAGSDRADGGNLGGEGGVQAPLELVHIAARGVLPGGRADQGGGVGGQPPLPHLDREYPHARSAPRRQSRRGRGGVAQEEDPRVDGPGARVCGIGLVGAARRRRDSEGAGAGGEEEGGGEAEGSRWSQGVSGRSGVSVGPRVGGGACGGGEHAGGDGWPGDGVGGGPPAGGPGGDGCGHEPEVDHAWGPGVDHGQTPGRIFSMRLGPMPGTSSSASTEEMWGWVVR